MDETFVVPKHPIGVDAAEEEAASAREGSEAAAEQPEVGVIIPVESDIPEGATPVVQALPVLLFEKGRDEAASGDETDAFAKPKKSHRGLKITLIVIAAVLVVLGVFAYTQYRALMRVVDELQADGAALSATVDDISASVQNMDFDAMLTQVQDMRSTIAHMRGLISTPEFDVASHIPTYGGDVLTARSMMDIALDLADNAALPLLGEMVDHPFSSLISRENGINVAGVYAIVDAAEAAIPVAEADLDALEALDEFAIPQLAEATEPAFENLGKARSALGTAKSLFEQYKSMLDTFIGRDGSGLAVQFWDLISLFLPEGEITLESLMELIEQFSGLFDGNGGLDLGALLGMLLGGDGGEGSGDGGFGLESLLPFIGLLFGGDESGDGSLALDSLLPFIGLLFGGDESGDQDASGGYSDPGDEVGTEDGTDLLDPLLGLLFGEDGEGIFDLFGLLFSGSGEDAEYAA